MPSQTFLSEIRCRKTFIWSFFFFRITCIFGNIQHQSECVFPFLYNFIFKPYNLSRPVAPLSGEIDICLRGLFCPKFNAKKVLFEAFIEILRIFGSIQPESECIFPFLYNLIFQLNTGNNHILSPGTIKNGVCPHSGCSSALVWYAAGINKLSDKHEKCFAYMEITLKSRL